MTHSLVALDDRFNIVRFKVAATHDHGLLYASQNVELAAVEIASITRVVPAVPNRRLRQLRIAKVSLHERRPTDTDLSGRPIRQGTIVSVTDLALESTHRSSDSNHLDGLLGWAASR